MSLTIPGLQAIMERAVDECVAHVDDGGLPFVGVVVNDTGVISEYGVNQVRESGDPSAHAEIMAMRDAMATHGLETLAGTTLLATGEPCGLCYRFAIDHQIDAIYTAVDRDTIAGWGFDYRTSYLALRISDEQRAGLLHHLPVDRGMEPVQRYLYLNTPNPGTPARPHHASKGTS